MNTRPLSSDPVLRAWIAVAKRSFEKLQRSVVLALVILISPVTTHGQNNTTGAIFGRVQAASTITAEHAGMGFSRTAVAAADGAYRIAALPPGTYKVSYTDATGARRAREVEVAIDIGTQVDGSDVVQLDRVIVGGMSINPVDFSNTTSVSIFTDKQLHNLPVGLNTTEVALLAPGTVTGDSTWGLPSFGGASVAENAYFLNGFNVTSFFRGLGGASIPFEFYNQFEVNTGAYSAEFGRSTGGVINATSKSGSNQFHFTASVHYWPEDGRANLPDTYYANNVGTIVPLSFNSRKYLERWDTNVSVSGPLWKNRLFVYALHQWRSSVDKDVFSSGTRYNRERSSDPFWAVKVDFIPFKNHHLEYTGMDTSRRSTTTQWNYDFAKKEIVTTVPPGVSYDDAGGKTHIGRYTGTFFDRLTLSALVGRGESNRTAHSSLDNVSRVDDVRGGGSAIRLAGGPNLTVIDALETRKAIRFDAEYSFTLVGSHRLRAGYDEENNLTDQQGQYGGGAFYRYETVTPGQTLQGGTVPAGVTQVVRRQIFRNGGAFKVNSDAWYVEDNWTTMKNRLVIRAGLRSESFENLDKNQRAFIAIDNQLAPRLGAAYDLFGNQKTKVFANYGRYHLPIATNVNVSQAGAEFLTTEWFALSSIGADFQPTLGAKIGDTAQTQAGIVRDQREITDVDIHPMYQDEWVLGVQHALSKKYKVGLRGVARNFGYAIDDMLVNHALVEWARANGYPNYTYSGPSARAYVLANAGRPITMYWDFNKNGTIDTAERATLTPQMLGYPSAERKYYAVEFSAEKVVDGKWGAQFSYTWAHSYGNYEGLVHSDSNQSSTGLTRLFDTPALTMNTYGDLPNDRRHQFKLLGTYLLTRELTLGANLQLLSGRARNRLGLFNDPIVGTQYGPYYLQVPRGSVGRTPWQFRQDLTLTYRPRWIAEKRLTFSATVFNVLNRVTPTERIEFAQLSSGAPDLTYGMPNAWMSPRSVRLSARFEY